MEVSRSGYYRYLEEKDSMIAKEIPLIALLKNLHKRSNGSYGNRRMAKALSAEIGKIGRYKVRRLMRQNGIICKQRRRYTVTTQSVHAYEVAKNHLNRNFYVAKPNSAWVADITYLWTSEGWLYIAAVLDLFSRRVVGWATADNMRTELIMEAFIMAKAFRQPPPGLMHHSDRGVQYASTQYRQLLSDSDVIVSMSRKCNCWDNAVMERFFGSLKSERTDEKIYATRSEAKADVADFIERFYNSQRLHSSLNYTSPIAYESNFMAGRVG